MARTVGTPGRTRLYRERGPGERWWFGLLLIPALLTAAVVLTQGDAIESELERDALAQLRTAGLPHTQVEMAGRNATLLVPTGEDENAALAAAREVEGIADVEVVNVAANAREARACEVLQHKIDRAGDQQGIAFAGGSTTMTGSGLATVRSVGRLLVACPSAVVVAEGHTDPAVINGGKVSLGRAEAVRNALARAGVKKSRVSVKGFGDSYPVSTGDTGAARARNNRVEVTVAGE